MAKGKRNVVVYLECELVEIAKNNALNLSKEFNEYLKTRLFPLINVPDRNKKETLNKLIVETQNKLISFQRKLETLEKTEEIKIKAKDEKRQKEMEDLLK